MEIKNAKTLSDLNSTLKHSDRHMVLSRLVTLLISLLRHSDIEASNFYNSVHPLYVAALVTRCNIQHAFWPYKDSKINHTRHFIKIQFVNKEIELIKLSCIFKDQCIIFSIPTYFGNKQSPIICYKHSKPYHSTGLAI